MTDPKRNLLSHFCSLRRHQRSLLVDIIAQDWAGRKPLLWVHLEFHAKTRILSNFICPTLTIARRQVTTALWSLMQDTESEGGRSTKITSMLHQWIGSCCNIRRLVYLLPFCPKSSYLFSFLLITKFEI